MKKFLVSYPQTNWEYAKFRLNRILRGKDKSNEVFEGDPGGKLELFEHQGTLGSARSIGSWHPVKPFGMHYVEGEGLYFVNGLTCSKTGIPGNERISRLNARGEIDLEIHSPLLTQVRSLRRTERGLLVTACGIDALLEFDLRGQLIWSWWATEHGYTEAYGGGRRVIDKSLDHRGINYPGSKQATHLNSALIDPHDADKVLTILFYQGQVARIDRATGHHEIVVSGLSGAHHLRPHPRGYLLSNSRRGEVLVFDREFTQIERIRCTPRLFPLKWVQDAIVTPQSTLLIADCNTFRLRERDASGKERSVKTHMPNRAFQIEPVPEHFNLPSTALGTTPA